MEIFFAYDMSRNYASESLFISTYSDILTLFMKGFKFMTYALSV